MTEPQGAPETVDYDARWAEIQSLAWQIGKKPIETLTPTEAALCGAFWRAKGLLTTKKELEHELSEANRRLAAVKVVDESLVDALNAKLKEAEARLAEARPSVPYKDIEAEIEHIKQNGISLAKFGGESVDEGRCRELCAMYLREFITAHKLKLRIDRIAKGEG